MNKLKNVLFALLLTAEVVMPAVDTVQFVNAERTLKPYLIWTAFPLFMNMVPPTLHPVPERDHHYIGRKLLSMMGDAEANSYFLKYAQTIDWGNKELVNKNEITPRDIQYLHGIIIGSEKEFSELRSTGEYIDRYALPIGDLRTAQKVLETEGHLNRFADENEKTRYKHHLEAFSTSEGLQTRWLEIYINVMRSPAGHTGNPLDIINSVKDRDKSLGRRLFDTDFPPPSELEDLLTQLCDLLNSTAHFTASGEFCEQAMCRAAQVLTFVFRKHLFEDGNGRLGRFLANIVLVRAGFLPAVFPKDLYDKYIREEIDAGPESAGAAIVELIKIALKKTLLWIELPPMTTEHLDGYLRQEVSHPILDVEDHMKEVVSIASYMMRQIFGRK